MNHLASTPNVKDCCKQDDSLELTKISETEVVNTCKVCGCRHFELSVDPMLIGIRGADLSKPTIKQWY